MYWTLQVSDEVRHKIHREYGIGKISTKLSRREFIVWWAAGGTTIEKLNQLEPIKENHG